MRSKTSATLLLLATFALGGISGSIAYYLYQVRATAAQSQRSFRGSGPHNPVDELASGLQLNPEQKQKLTVIIEQSGEKYRKLSREFRPQYEGIRQETRQAIREILMPEQKERFEEIIRREQERRRPRAGRESK
jgi:Spy/CpxP family protein refolding chaperone